MKAGDRKATRPYAGNRNKTTDSLSRHAADGAAHSAVPIGRLGEEIQLAAKQTGLLRRYRDDRIQSQTTGRISPESFTHGTAAQRAGWFKRGFDSGQAADCDTFSGDI